MATEKDYGKELGGGVGLEVELLEMRSLISNFVEAIEDCVARLQEAASEIKENKLLKNQR